MNVNSKFAVDFLIDLGGNTVAADKNCSLTLGGDTVKTSHRGEVFTMQEYGHLDCALKGNGDIVVDSVSRATTDAYVAALFTAKMTQASIAGAFTLPPGQFAGDFGVGDLEIGGKDPEFLELSYAVFNMGAVTLT